MVAFPFALELFLNCAFACVGKYFSINIDNILTPIFRLHIHAPYNVGARFGRNLFIYKLYL
jgi:hypothetical protein